MAAKKAPPRPVVKVAKKNASRVPLNPESKTSKRLASMTDENLTPAQRARADLFVLHYLRDFNATQSFIRTRKEEDQYSDVDLNYAMNAGYQMTRWPYVAQKIQQAMDDAEEKNIVTRNEVMWGLKREANYHGMGASHGARVGSWGKLASILGMEQKKVEQNLALRGGVMIVPPIDGVDSWEERAAAAQAQLKDEVRK